MENIIFKALLVIIAVIFILALLKNGQGDNDGNSKIDEEVKPNPNVNDEGGN